MNATLKGILIGILFTGFIFAGWFIYNYEINKSYQKGYQEGILYPSISGNLPYLTNQTGNISVQYVTLTQYWQTNCQNYLNQLNQQVKP